MPILGFAAIVPLLPDKPATMGTALKAMVDKLSTIAAGRQPLRGDVRRILRKLLMTGGTVALLTHWIGVISLHKLVAMY